MRRTALVTASSAAFRRAPDDSGEGAVRALVPQTGQLKWEYKLYSKPQAGILSTVGGLVFGGTDEGQFFALDAQTGKELWRAQLGGVIVAAPVTYLSQGKQQVAIAAGHSIFVFQVDE